MHNDEIQTRPFPACPVCGSGGSPLYDGLSDRIFNAPGLWDMRKCNNQDCGTLWLDPMPVEADLPKLYAGYYTHQSPAIHNSSKRLRALLDRVLDARLHARYGYVASSRSWIDRLLALAAYLHPGWCDGMDAGVFHLHAQPGGRLLEIGCGGGAAMQFMKQKGWDVAGLDFDEGAVSNARSKGLDVRQGQLSAQAFADDCFDAVVMSHVIEHVPAAGELLAECRRILKKGGVLVVLTPNAASRGHKRYGRNWRGLEPPRHLQVFTLKSLARIANASGYADVETFTSMNGFVYQDLASKELAAGTKHSMGGNVTVIRRLFSHIMWFGLGWWNVLLHRRDGEEAVLVCHK